MSEIRKIKEFTTTVLKTKITGLSDEIARDYQECTVKITGLNARQTIDLKIEAVNDGKTTTIFAQKITVGREVHLVGPFKIDRRCQIAISGDVTGQLVNPAHCKIESVISYDDSSMRTLRLGVFFDGTGCNASNSEKYFNSFSSIGDYLESLIEKVNDSIIPKSYRYTPQLSYVSGLSNIWNLYRSFTEGRIDEKTYQAKTYIEGTGTKKDALDSMFTMGTGWSPPVGPQTGVIAKTDDAVQQIKDLLAKLGNDFDRVELYIFGFSRGSTSARHFANRIEKQDRTLLSAFDIKKYGAPEVRFIGLYDTVASILALSQGDIDVSDSKTGDVDISMDDAIAEDVFHITAGHEVRENYSSNHVTPVFKKELKLPGVHEDIGGQFHEKVEERMYLTQVLYSSSRQKIDNEDTSSYKKSKEDLQRLLNVVHWGKIYEASGISIASEVRDRPLLPTLYANAVQLRREAVYPGLNFVAFQAMRYYAGKIGLAFSELPGEDVETIPDDLQDLHDQALQQIDHLLAGGTATSLVDYLSPALGAKYVHNSAFWDEAPNDLVVDETGIIDDATFNLLLINRPHEGNVRREFNADGSVYTDPA